MTRKLLCSYLYLKQEKCHFFSFFFYKIEEQEGRTDLAGGGYVGTSGRG
jgi:hypothetical protein